MSDLSRPGSVPWGAARDLRVIRGAAFAAAGPAAVVTEILLTCTANICRSPMAALLLSRELASRGVPAQVRSAGTLGGGVLPPPEVTSVMAAYGMDAAGHLSRQVTAGDLQRADLLLAMTRENLRHAVVTAPEVWPRAFTLRELTRRGARAGCRAPGETLAGWLARVHEGRSRLALLGEDPADDVADPIGGPLSAYAATAAELQDLAGRVADLCWARDPGAAPPVS